MSFYSWFLLLLFSGLALYWLLSKPPALELPKQIKGRVSYIVDGDSLYITGHKQQIRLWGVDAPEKKEPGFEAATDHLAQIADKQKISCLKIDTDHYGRTVARCFLSNGREINRLMIEGGKAQEYHYFSKGFYSR